MYYLYHLTTVKRDGGRPPCKHRPMTMTVKLDEEQGIGELKKSTKLRDKKPIKEESERGNGALENHISKEEEIEKGKV